MANETADIQRPSNAQKTFAIALVASVIATVSIGGWYLRRTHRGGTSSSAAVQSGTGSRIDSIQVDNFAAQITGDFKISGSDVKIEFKDSLRVKGGG